MCIRDRNITFGMKNTKKKLNSQSKIVKASFSGSNITKYSGLNTVAKYMNRKSIVKGLGKTFLTVWHNATKFGVDQILMAITLSSISCYQKTPNGCMKADLKISHWMPIQLLNQSVATRKGQRKDLTQQKTF